MSYDSWKNLFLALALSLALAASAMAQQSPPGRPPAPPGPPPAVTPGGAESPPMPPRMEGMRQRRHERMERMQGMQGQGGKYDSNDDDDDDDDDDDTPSKHGRRGHHGMFLRLAQKLDLTEEQRAKARTLWHTHRKQVIRLRADIATAAIDLHELLETDPVNLPKAKELTQAMAVKRGDLHYGHIALMQDIRALLTPEQQKKFHTLMGKMPMHGMHRHH